MWIVTLIVITIGFNIHLIYHLVLVCTEYRNITLLNGLSQPSPCTSFILMGSFVMIGLKILPGLAFFSKNMNVWFIDQANSGYSINNTMTSSIGGYRVYYIEFSYRYTNGTWSSLVYYTYIHRFYLDCYYYDLDL